MNDYMQFLVNSLSNKELICNKYTRNTWFSVTKK